VRAMIEKAAVGGKGKKVVEGKGEREEDEGEEKTFLQKWVSLSLLWREIGLKGATGGQSRGEEEEEEQDGGFGGRG